MKDLIEIHSEEPQLIHCDYCDNGESILTDVWYIPSENFGLRSVYLSCCVDKIGEVVDWDFEKAGFKKD